MIVRKQTGRETWTPEQRQAESEYQKELVRLRTAIWKARTRIEAATESRNQAVVAMAEMGVSYRHIAEVSGLTHPTVSEIVRRAGVSQEANS
jgi:DNA-binding NarL/FixJ family response regulator